AHFPCLNRKHQADMLRLLQRSLHSIAAFGGHPQTDNFSITGGPLLQGVCDPLGFLDAWASTNYPPFAPFRGSSAVLSPSRVYSQLATTLVVVLRSSERLANCFADWNSIKRCEATSKTAANTATKPAVARSAPSFIPPTPQTLGT